MKTERFRIGPFTFTFRGGRVWWRYKTRHFSTRIEASGATSISTGTALRCFIKDPQGERSNEGLNTFVRYHMGDIPGALHWADHYSKFVTASMIRTWRI